MTRLRLRVPLGAASYDILLGDDVLADLPRLVSQHAPAAHYAVISDSTVAPLHAENIATALRQSTPATLATFDSGERSKTRETWSALTDQLSKAGIGRDGTVLAVGGGVVGDLAGFVAATYCRGIPCVQVPTTLLAMIDSSIGGKTGVDTPFGKNLVGAFHQPRLVLADVTTLATLPWRQLAAGLAEALKHAAIADAGYFARLVKARPGLERHDIPTLLEVVRRSLEIKIDVVAGDVRENGRRAILNFGHTVAHALEAISAYQLLHGEAVAIGLATEAALGERIGVTARGTTDQVIDGLRVFGLPTTPTTAVEPDQLLAAMVADKKTRAGSVRFALLERIGRVACTGDGGWTHEVKPEIIRATFARRS